MSESDVATAGTFACEVRRARSREAPSREGAVLADAPVDGVRVEVEFTMADAESGLVAACAEAARTRSFSLVTGFDEAAFGFSVSFAPEFTLLLIVFERADGRLLFRSLWFFFAMLITCSLRFGLPTATLALQAQVALATRTVQRICPTNREAALVPQLREDADLLRAATRGQAPVGTGKPRLLTSAGS